jgi:hypothetical protein
MNVLIDFHHGELYESLLKLFQDRLGCNVYRPIGFGWYTQGYYTLFTDESTLGQYLGLEHKVLEEVSNGIYRWQSPEYEFTDSSPRRVHNVITIDAAKEINWDIVVTSYPTDAQWDVMEKFISNFCPNAKHICQVGNMSYPVNPKCKNVMNSTNSPCDAPNQIRYHQEFDLKTLYRERPTDQNTISTLLHSNSLHTDGAFLKLEEFMGWKFKEYGFGNRGGNVLTYKGQCDAIRNSSFYWHVKMSGDGYGYNIHRAIAAGRPVIVNYGHFYRDHHILLQGDTFDVNKTIIDFHDENLLPKSFDRLKSELELKLDMWDEHSEYIHRRFRELVNFDDEFESMKKFLDNLI